MDPTLKTGAPGIEFPRGDIEIIPPGSARAAGDQPFAFEHTAHTRAFSFRTGPGGGFLAMAFAGIVAIALFTFLAGALAIIATVAAIGFAGFYLRRWLGR